MSSNVIIAFKDSATKEEVDSYVQSVVSHGGSVGHKYDSSAIKGFSASIPDSYLQDLKSSLTSDNPIEYIEPDSIVTTQ